MKLKKSNKLINGYNSFESNLLINRGITTEGEADYYFNANFDDLGDYWKIKDLKSCAYFIKEVIENKKKIIIFGDYDVDGVVSTNIMYETLLDCGANVSWRLPCRIKEGYGININAIKEIIKQDYDLIITVDNGIRAINEIKYAREHGVDVVVLDHHVVGKEMPCANYVIDLHRPDETYHFHHFAGCGVAFMMARALYFLFGFNDDYCKKHLDVVAIGTIADVMNLIGENRILVKEGLKIISNVETYNRLGITYLLRLNYLSDNVSSTDIGFSIAPCLNAPGRLLENGADRALELLLEKDTTKAKQLANYLYRVNEVRKEKTKEGLKLAEQYIKDNFLINDNIIVLYLENMEEGIIGLISGKITEKYYRPSIVFTKNAKGNYKASARSIPTIDLYECLCSCHPLYLKYGGHGQAAGLEIKPKDFETLRMCLNTYIEDNYDKSCFDREVYYELEVKNEEIDNSLMSKLEKFEPCGMGNPRPLLYIKEYPTINRKTKYSNELKFYSLYGDNEQHVTIYGEHSEIQGFYLGDKFNELNRPNTLSCLFTLEYADVCGVRQMVLVANDINEAIISSPKTIRNVDVKNKIKNLVDLL